MYYQVERAVLTKYNLMSPIAMNVAILASCHGMEQFKEYLALMKKVEEAVRAGTTFLHETLDAPFLPLLHRLNRFLLYLQQMYLTQLHVLLHQLHLNPLSLT
mgnify:CR=1 FL=1